jgi:heterodisulfide reductase subunit C
MENQSQSKVTMCMQCGMCSGSCPESGMTPFNIRLLVRKNLFTGRDLDSLVLPLGECTSMPQDKPRMIFELRASWEGEIP